MTEILRALDESPPQLNYYASKLSDNVERTPEGYLVCKGVKLARSGFQTYTKQELTKQGNARINALLEKAPGNSVAVWRDPQEVVSAEALASFEGKSFTLLHPADFINTENVRKLEMGHVQNIRAEVEGDVTYMVGDIIIKAQEAIDAFNAGTRDVSCGYDYTWALTDDGHLAQTNLRGNHIALVPKGRAGGDVRINDSADALAVGAHKENQMSLKKLFGFGLQAAAKDPNVTPEQLADLAASARDAAPEEEGAPAGNAGGNTAEELIARIEQLEQAQQQFFEIFEELLGEEAEEPQHQGEGGGEGAGNVEPFKSEDEEPEDKKKKDEEDKKLKSEDGLFDADDVSSILATARANAVAQGTPQAKARYNALYASLKGGIGEPGRANDSYAALAHARHDYAPASTQKYEEQIAASRARKRGEK